MPEDKSSPDFVFYVSKTKISDLVSHLYHNIVLSWNEQWYEPLQIKCIHNNSSCLLVYLFLINDSKLLCGLLLCPVNMTNLTLLHKQSGCLYKRDRNSNYSKELSLQI